VLRCLDLHVAYDRVVTSIPPRMKIVAACIALMFVGALFLLVRGDVVEALIFIAWAALIGANLFVHYRRTVHSSS
jgi:hypothetical protein